MVTRILWVVLLALLVMPAVDAASWAREEGAPAKPPEATTPLVEIDSFEPLAARFNEDNEYVRGVVILSPN